MFTDTPPYPPPKPWKTTHPNLADEGHTALDEIRKVFDEASPMSRPVKQEADPHGKAANEPGAKLDNGKLQPWLCIAGFSRALAEVAQVTTFGARKYTPNGWVTVPNGQERYMEAFGRHMLALGEGKIVDDGLGGTGCLHKAQMIWNLLASLELDLREAEAMQAAANEVAEANQRVPSGHSVKVAGGAL